MSRHAEAEATALQKVELSHRPVVRPSGGTAAWRGRRWVLPSIRSARAPTEVEIVAMDAVPESACMRNAVSQIDDGSHGPISDVDVDDDRSDWARGRNAFAAKVPVPQAPLLLPLPDVALKPSRHRSLRERRMNSKTLPLSARTFMSSPAGFAGRAEKGAQKELSEEGAMPCPDANGDVCIRIRDADSECGSRVIDVEVAALGVNAPPASVRHRSLPRYLKELRMQQFAPSPL